MTDTPQQEWLATNQRHLAAAITSVRYALELHASRATPERLSAATQDGFEAAIVLRDALGSGMTDPPALDALCEVFGLSSFEGDALVLCAAMELEASFAAACAAAQGDALRPYPTFGLALAALPGSHWSAITPAGPLRAWHLVEYASGGLASAPLTTRPIRVDERILHYLTGVHHLDERLAGIVTLVGESSALVPSHAESCARIVRLWTDASPGSRPPVVALHGPDMTSTRAVAAQASRSCGFMVYGLTINAIPSTEADLNLLVRLWNREIRLAPATLLIDCDAAHLDPQRESFLAELIERVDGPVVVASRERRQSGSRPVAAFEIVRPTAIEQRTVWAGSLPGDRRRSRDGDVDRLTSQFSLNVVEILSAAAEARASTADDEPFTRLWEICRAKSRGRLDDLAQRIVSPAVFEDLVLPDAQKDVLRDIVMHVKHRSIVHHDWGFGAGGQRGLGISALFAGPSGTGKTMAAEVLAGALRLDLYRVDLSSVVSKYIGETEKNLRRIFDAADAGGVILLFDEADALFGKRSEVKDSHDRYANIEVSYLLQRMESYRGLAILTTNLKSALDQAFFRRIRFVVQFQFPDASQREQIWRRAFPSTSPTRDLDVTKLAQLNVAGGSIRNVALKAAFLAAGCNEPIGMAHLLSAARSEYAKLEKPLTDAEVAGWLDVPSSLDMVASC